MMSTAWAILRKDLQIELRTKESVPAMALFSVTVFVLFHFGLQRNALEGDLAAGVLWVTLILATVLDDPSVRAAKSRTEALSQASCYAAQGGGLSSIRKTGGFAAGAICIAYSSALRTGSAP